MGVNRVVGVVNAELVALESVTATLQNIAGQDYCRPGDIFWSNRFWTCNSRQAGFVVPSRHDSCRPKFAGCFCF